MPCKDDSCTTPKPAKRTQFVRNLVFTTRISTAAVLAIGPFAAAFMWHWSILLVWPITVAVAMTILGYPRPRGSGAH
jgi:hypothetical protein